MATKAPPKRQGRPSKKPLSSSGETLCITVEGHNAANRSYDQLSSQAGEATLTLNIPNGLLWKWHTEKNDHQSYISLANEAIVDEMVTLNAESHRLEKTFERRVYDLHRRIAKQSGRKREALLQGAAHVFVLQGESLSHSQLLTQRDMAIEEAEAYRHKTVELERTLQELHEEMVQEIDQYNATIVKQQKDLASLTSPRENKGKQVDDISPRHARRKLSDFKTKAQQALFFAESFGLQLESLRVTTTTGREVTIPFNQASPTTTPSHTAELDKVLQVLYLLDRFGVGDTFYHELSMSEHTLPRSYRVKRAREALNATAEIERMPGFAGAYRDFEQTLSQQLANIVSPPPTHTQVSLHVLLYVSV